MAGEARFVGIDVSKAQLDVAVRPTGKRWTLPYDQTGIEGLIPQIVDLEPALVLLEATGGLELPLVAALAAAALPVVVVNPRQVRDFAKATGTLAKTDTLDAGVLAHFADAVRPDAVGVATQPVAGQDIYWVLLGAPFLGPVCCYKTIIPDSEEHPLATSGR